MQFGFVKLTELIFETQDRNYILTKKKNPNLNFQRARERKWAGSVALHGTGLS